MLSNSTERRRTGFTRAIVFAATPVLLVTALTACGSPSSSTATTTVTEYIDRTYTVVPSTTKRATASTPTLKVGDSVDVPCDSNDSVVCMTLKLTDLNLNAECSDSYRPADRYVALTFAAEMPADASPEFTSPFRSFPWSGVAGNRAVEVEPSVTCPGSSQLNLMKEFPGLTADGTVVLGVPQGTTEVRFAAHHRPLFRVAVGG